MQTFLITYKPATESRERGWPIEEIRRLANTCYMQGWAEENWRFSSFRKVSVGDRIFLLLQGRTGPAIIGFGHAIGMARRIDGRPRLPVRFESIVDPTVEVLVGRDELLRIEGASLTWRTRSSGVLLSELVGRQLESLVSQAEWTVQGLDDGPDEAPEGRLSARLHFSHERDPALVESKKKRVFRQYNALSCEVCGFDFAAHYGSRGKRFIECHHTKPISTLSAGDVTHVDDLSLVCANCHRMIHRYRPWLSIEELRVQIARLPES